MKWLDLEKIFVVSKMVGKYAISGFCGIGVNLLIFTLLVSFTDLWFITASFLGFIGAYATTFLMHKYWTFKNTSKELFYAQSLVYLFSSVTTLAINTAILYLLVEHFTLPAVFAQFTALLTSALLSFLFTTQVTFHARSSRIQAFTNFLKNTPLRKALKFWKPIACLLILLSVCVIVRILFFPLAFSSDAVSYVATAEHFLGNESVPIYGERILKPLAPAIVALLSLLGITPSMALLVQAVALYFVLGIAVFFFGWELFRKQGHALVLAIIVVTSYPIFRYGLDYYTETGAWVFYFATLAFSIRWYRKPDFGLLVLISLLLLGGLLWKEYIVLAGAIFGLMILFQKELSFIQRIHALVQTAFLVLIPWGIWQFAVYELYHYSYIDWLAIGSSSEAYGSEYTFFQVGKTLFALLFAVWGLVIYGMLGWKNLTPLFKKIILMMLVPSFGFLLWGYVSSRLFFSLVPLVAPLAVLGFFSLQSIKARILVILLVIIVNSILIVLTFDSGMRALLNSLS